MAPYIVVFSMIAVGLYFSLKMVYKGFTSKGGGCSCGNAPGSCSMSSYCSYEKKDKKK